MSGEISTERGAMPNYWGWSPGHQETAEFKILEAYFIAAYGISKRICEIEHPNFVHSNHDGWLLTFIDNTTLEIPQ